MKNKSFSKGSPAAPGQGERIEVGSVKTELLKDPIVNRVKHAADEEFFPEEWGDSSFTLNQLNQGGN